MYSLGYLGTIKEGSCALSAPRWIRRLDRLCPRACPAHIDSSWPACPAISIIEAPPDHVETPCPHYRERRDTPGDDVKGASISSEHALAGGCLRRLVRASRNTWCSIPRLGVRAAQGVTQIFQKLTLLLLRKPVAFIEQSQFIHGNDAAASQSLTERAAECDEGLLRRRPFEEVDPRARTVIQQNLEILFA
jgi:hypothetical protein